MGRSSLAPERRSIDKPKPKQHRRTAHRDALCRRYLRVSTGDQDLTGREREVRQYAAAHGLELTGIYREKVPGTGKVERAEYNRLWDAARSKARTWVHLIVWSLDRFSREEKLSRAFASLEELENLGIQFHSVKEPFLNTDVPGMGREILRALVPVVASYESRHRSERVRVAMDEIASGRRVTRSGRPVGRPAQVTLEKIRAIEPLARTRVHWGEIAERVGLPKETCRKAFYEWRTGRRRVENTDSGERLVRVPRAPEGEEGKP
jgi:DNA invertase Pin-like site-specific DNA recombinase